MPADYNCSRLNERIKIMRPMPIDDGQGGFSENWVEHVSISAHVKPLSGRERDNAAQIVSPRNYQIIMRNSSISRGIKANDRIVWRGLAMEITFIAFSGVRNAYMMLDCLEQKNFAQDVII